MRKIVSCQEKYEYVGKKLQKANQDGSRIHGVDQIVLLRALRLLEKLQQGTLSDQDFGKIMGNLLSSREVLQGMSSDQETEKGTSDKIWEGHIDFESDPWPYISATAKSRPSDHLTIHEDLCTLFLVLGR
ncbi:hypothetical protein Tco_1070381 [Tanacetum coccineum]|uniref:Uncharacterized protein n=1 Tax=Tanacetum coccineum TaxID=301880 RepID=A0ABQ5HML9_9ASTR